MHGNVVRLGWHIIEKLEGEADALQVGTGESGQETVVIAFASAQTMTAFVERHAWDNGKVNLAVALKRKHGSNGFLYAESPFPQGCLAFVQAEFEVVACDDRQKDTFPFVESIAYQPSHIHLVGQRIIKQESPCLLPMGRKAHSPAYLSRHLSQQICLLSAFLRFDVLAQLLFRHFFAFFAAFSLSLSYFSQSFFFVQSCFCASVLATAAASAAASS